MQFSVATCSLGLFLDSITTDFDNVVIVFLFNSLVLSATPTFFATSFSFPYVSGIYRDIIFLVATSFFSSSYLLCRYSISMSRQDFFSSLIISFTAEFSLSR